jgi:hypothetical protein
MGRKVYILNRRLLLIPKATTILLVMGWSNQNMATKSASQIHSTLVERIAELSATEPNQGLKIPDPKGLSDEELLVVSAILARKRPQYPGIHTVYGGLNKALRAQFGADIDPKAITQAMEKKGLVVVTLAKGGAFVRLHKIDEGKPAAAKKTKDTPKVKATPGAVSAAVRNLIG